MGLGSGFYHFENLTIRTTLSHDVLIAGSASARLYYCKFSEGTRDCPLVCVDNRATAVLFGCEVTKSGAGGVLVVGGANATVQHCDFSGCVISALEVRAGGSCTISETRLHDSKQGLLVWSSAGAVVAHNTKCYRNSNEGVLVSQNEPALRLTNCDVFANGQWGVSVDRYGKADLKHCRIFDNIFWGLFVKTRSYASLESCDVFANKCGGVRIGINFSAEVVIKNTRIHDNCGPGLHDLVRCDSADLRKMNAVPKAMLRASGELPPDEDRLYSRKPELHNVVMARNESCIPMVDDPRICSFCRNADVEKYRICGQCLGARYCNAACQRAHWPRHKADCKRAKAECTYDIPAPTEAIVLRPNRTPEPATKKPPHSGGGRFIVKIQTLEMNSDPEQELTVYDKTRTFIRRMRCREVYNLIMQHGVLGQNQFTSKKLFFYAMYDADGKARLLTKDLAPFKQW